MAQVCKWLGYYLCMRDTPKTDTIHPDGAMFDAVIVWKESPKGKEKSGGMAYEVILKPAAGDSPAPRPKSPPKERPLSQELIDKKLKEAEERRQSAEVAKLQLVAKDEARRQEAAQKIAEQNKSFSEETEKKLQEKLKIGEENKTKQIKELQERLRDHAQKVEEVRKQSEVASQKLKEKIYEKLDSAEENRQNQIKSIRLKLQEHEKHIKDVLDSVKDEEEKKKEKMIEKMETTLKNREEQLRNLVVRLQEHEKHIQEVREKRLSNPVGEPVEQNCS